MREWLDEAVTATAAAAALAAIVVQIAWFLRAEAGAPATIGACAGLSLLAFTAPKAQLSDVATTSGFTGLALSVPSAIMLLIPAPVQDSVERLAGVDAVSTAVAVSAEAFEQADVAVVALATEPRHALIAASLASSRGAPLLLTGQHRLPSHVVTEITRLGAHRVVVVAGAAKQVLERQLTPLGVATDQITGTAVEVAATIARARPVSPWLVTDVFDASGRVRPSVAEAIMRGAPLLLSEGGRVPLVSAGALLEARPERLVLDVADQAEIRRVLGEVLGSRASRGFGATTVDRTGRWVAAARSPLDVAVSATSALRRTATCSSCDRTSGRSCPAPAPSSSSAARPPYPPASPAMKAEPSCRWLAAEPLLHRRSGACDHPVVVVQHSNDVGTGEDDPQLERKLRRISISGQLVLRVRRARLGVEEVTPLALHLDDLVVDAAGARADLC